MLAFSRLGFLFCDRGRLVPRSVESGYHLVSVYMLYFSFPAQFFKVRIREGIVPKSLNVKFWVWLINNSEEPLLFSMDVQIHNLEGAGIEVN